VGIETQVLHDVSFSDFCFYDDARALNLRLHLTPSPPRL